MLTVLTYPHPHLKIVCEPVTEFGTELMPVVQQMVATMIGRKGIGLAANQVGLSQRIFVMELADTYQEFVNPEIIEGSDELLRNEGCLSFPGVRASVKRFNKIKIKAKTFMGNDVEMDLEGRDAICFQHELDHINGKTFFDNLSPLKQSMIQKKISKMVSKESKKLK